MDDLEHTSPTCASPRARRPIRPELRPASSGRLRHPPCEHLPRHSHEKAFAALVLSGGYIEAGDSGRFRMEAGDVLLHAAWESHLDRFDCRGAEVLMLPIADLAPGFVAGRVADADAIARLAEADPEAAAYNLVRTTVAKPPVLWDWQDILARSIRDNPSLSVTAWANDADLHIGSVSRGFRQVFGMTPIGYRLVQRTRRAIQALQCTQVPLSEIAQTCGFADQAHMSRAVGHVSSSTPATLRRTARPASNSP